jgi:hypothetical protein
MVSVFTDEHARRWAVQDAQQHLRVIPEEELMMLLRGDEVADRAAGRCPRARLVVAVLRTAVVGGAVRPPSRRPLRF